MGRLTDIQWIERPGLFYIGEKALRDFSENSPLVDLTKAAITAADLIVTRDTGEVLLPCCAFYALASQLAPELAEKFEQESLKAVPGLFPAIPDEVTH